jgi:hypothetical protein
VAGAYKYYGDNPERVNHGELIMFEIRCIVHDKKLVEVIDALDGITLEPPVIKRVADTANPAQPKQLAKIRMENGGSVKALSEWLSETKPKWLRAREIKETLVAKGFSPKSYSHALTVLRKQGVLKKGQEKYTYEVNLHG